MGRELCPWNAIRTPDTLPRMSLKRAKKRSFAYQLVRPLGRRYWRASYAQFGEDIVLQTLFADRRRGVHELSVLGSFDFAAYQPSVVVVEAHVRDIDAALGSPLYELLVGHGYHLTHWLNPSLIFQRSRAPEGTAVEPGPKVAP